MKNVKALTEELKISALILKTDTEKMYRLSDVKPEYWGISNLLGAVMLTLRQTEIDLKEIKSHAVGIFRLVTDSSVILEDSQLGQGLMNFRLKLRELASMLEEDG